MKKYKNGYIIINEETKEAFILKNGRMHKLKNVENNIEKTIEKYEKEIPIINKGKILKQIKQGYNLITVLNKANLYYIDAIYKQHNIIIETTEETALRLIKNDKQTIYSITKELNTINNIAKTIIEESLQMFYIEENKKLEKFKKEIEEQNKRA